MTNDEEENLRKAINAGSATEEFSFKGHDTSGMVWVKMDTKWGIDIMFDGAGMNIYPEDFVRIWKEAKRFYNLPEP